MFLEVHLSKVLRDAKQLSGYNISPDVLVNPVFRGQYQREGYKLQKWGLRGEGDYILPILLFVPDGQGPFPGIVYAHHKGKAAEGLPGSQIEKLVHKGFVVAAVDLLGYGETQFYRTRGHGPVQPFYNAQLAGRSVAGINAGDALRVFNFLEQRKEVIQNNIGAVAVGATGPALLHAAAFEENMAWLVLTETISSYQSIVLNKFYQVNANSLVAGALTAYDLPDLHHHPGQLRATAFLQIQKPFAISSAQIRCGIND